ncbi:MAG TPA: DNA repair protein RecN [Terriglobales bacterium]|nr:DNA repair protein RecN [Terriglobales bacterium]
MLLELRVENYAVIDTLAVEFAPGLNLLTGETGAGKSILVDALALLLGEKASSDVVRHGAERAIVAGVFQPADEKHATAILDANGLSAEAGEPVIIRREIAPGGKGRVFVNNQPATVAVLRQLAPHLAAIHAQSESILSFDAAARLALLDQFAVLDTSAVAAAFDAWRDLRARLADLEQNEQDRLRLVDLWSFQKKEILGAALEPGEDERLETEKHVLANAERVYEAANTAFDLLYDGEHSAAAALRAAARPLEQLQRFDDRFRDAIAQLESARIAAEDLGIMLRDYAAGIQASPERLAEVEDRLALLDKLKRKYGATLADVIAFGEDVARKLDEVEDRDQALRRLKAGLGAAAEKYREAARVLSRRRAAAAKDLEKRVEAEVNDLAMKVKFRAEITADEASTERWTSSGFDQVRYLIATNPGDPLRPVEQIASGGELSRVMLALKVSVQHAGAASNGGRSRSSGHKPTTDDQRPTTLVFDEIDTGIGGRAAEAVGRKLKALAARYQVLCVTHLPQIAAFADQHFAIEKKEGSGRTRTSIRPLDAEERRREIARMLSGEKVTDTSLKHAEQMLRH